MMNKFCLMLLGALLFTTCLYTEAYGADDGQFWHSYSLKAKLAEDFSFKVTGEQRITDDFSKSTVANVSPGFLWHPSEHFEIGPFFKYERSKAGNGDHVNERRWLLEGTLKGSLGPLKISDRNRIAYRDRSSTDEWRYRNRIKLAYPIPVKSITLSPFVSEEIFWQWNEGSFNQNRVQLGVAAKLNKHVSFSLYYMIKSNRRGADWDDAQVVGTSLGLSF